MSADAAPEAQEKPAPSLSTTGLALVGMVLLFFPLLFITLFPDAYEPANFYLRLIASLGGALIGAFIPGLISVDLDWVKGAGALAIWLVVFLGDPSWDVYSNREPAGVTSESEAAGGVDGPMQPVEVQAPLQFDSLGSEPAADYPDPNDPPDDEDGSVEQEVEACTERSVAEYEGELERSVTGEARAPSAGLSGRTARAREDICLSVGPRQELVSAETEQVTCFGGRCSVSAPVYSNENRRVCVTARAWSESKMFGAGGKAAYRLVATYRNVADEEDRERFAAICRAGGARSG